MFNRIYSTLPSFRSLEFKSGMNILLTRKGKDSGDRHTRNRTGKTSLVELVHFLLGSNCPSQSIFKRGPLVNSCFCLDLNLQNLEMTVCRSGFNPNAIYIGGTDTGNMSLTFSVDEKGLQYISNAEWKMLLGKIAFKLRGERERYHPTFRMLFSYLSRRANEGGFSYPFRSRDMEIPWEVQVIMCFFLGLDWTISTDFQNLRDKEKRMKDLQKFIREGELDNIIGTVAHLRTKLAVLEKKRDRLREQLEQFRILPEYRDYEKEASMINSRLGEMSDANTMDRQLMNTLSLSLKDEASPKLEKLELVYKEVGVFFPDRISRRFEEIQAFHNSIIQNRESYLQGELHEIEKKVNNREKEMESMKERYFQIMRLLKSHGALDQYEQFLAELTKCEAEYNHTSSKFETAQSLELSKDELADERRTLKRRQREDFHERAEAINSAIQIFEEISSNLYQQPGNLIVNGESDNGPKFDIEIHGQRSIGIRKMQIFCLDMMLMRICQERQLGLGVLIHDSHLFDGVDDRQVAKALEYGARAAEECNFQYILTLNDDRLPSNEFSKDFEIDRYILPVHLTDDSDTGGLFGVTF